MITYSNLYRGEADRLTHYYGDQADDYYSRDGGAAVWQGEGANRLGLGSDGEVDVKRFHAMLRGDFGGGVQTGRSIRKDSRARAGIDLTFSAPKSITLQALVGGDARLVKAHDEAVAYTLDYIERNFARSRQTENKKVRIEETGNLIIAKFRHETARPTPGSPPDPNLHTHAVIMNATQRADGSWASLSNDQIVGLRKLQDAIYNARLDHLVKRLGYDVRYEKSHIELAHINRAAIEVFSKRSAQIEAELAGRGLDRDSASHLQKQMMTLATREKKVADLTRTELHHLWVGQAHNAGIDFEARHAPGIEHDNTGGTAEHPDHAVADGSIRWAIAHMSERESIMPRSELLANAIRHSAGIVSPQKIHEALARQVASGELLQNGTLYSSASDRKVKPMTLDNWASEVATLGQVPLEDARATVERAIAEGRLLAEEPLYATTAAFEAEKRIVAHEMAGRNAVEPIMSTAEVDAAIKGSTLTPGQQDALRVMLTETNQIVGIQGLAGTGKSFALQSAQRLLQEHGYSMVALAPYSDQMRNLRKDGIPANTVASFLTASDKRQFTEKMGPQTVVVIDEAGVVPVRQMDRLIAKVQATGARIVPLGDTAQTKAIEAGPAFALMQQMGMKTVVMRDIQRQKANPRLLHAVELASTGQASQSLPLVDQVACVKDTFKTDEHGHKARDSSARYERIAQEYTALSDAEQSKTLVVTGTNASRKAINTLVHRMRGLEGKGRTYRLLSRHDTTRAERSCAKYYTVGDIIQPERDYKCGLKRGELYQVVGCDRHYGRIKVLALNAAADVTPIEIMPKTMSRLSVYNAHDAELSVGDRVRVTRNNAAADLSNGQIAEVLEISEDSVVIEVEGRRVELPANQPLHLDHAYATTVHSAQGLTYERVFYNAESFSRTTAQDVYYVAISRGKTIVIVFTDDPEKLPKAIDRVPYKGLVHDLMQMGKGSMTREVAKPEHQHPQLEKPGPELDDGPSFGMG